MRKFLAFCLVIATLFSLAGCCLSHDFVEVARNDATCDTDGSVTSKCSNCEEEQTEVIPAVGHSFSEEVVQEATCTTVGLKKKTCSACGHTEDIEIAVLEHNYEYSVTKEPTLADYGIETGVCTMCGDTHEKEIMYLGVTKSNPGIVTVDELVKEIKSDIDGAKEKYNGKWVQITGKVLSAHNVAGMTSFYLYGEKGGSGLRIVCWVNEEVLKPFDYTGETHTFIGQVREITTVNATEIGDCEIVAD